MGESVENARIDGIIQGVVEETGEIEFEYMRKDEVVAKVWANIKTNEVRQEVYGERPHDIPIANPVKNKETLMEFFEERCFPRTRFNRDQLLKDLGLKTYNPYDIVRKTRGRMWDDFYWIRFKGDNVTFDDIKLRD